MTHANTTSSLRELIIDYVETKSDESAMRLIRFDMLFPRNADSLGFTENRIIGLAYAQRDNKNKQA